MLLLYVSGFIEAFTIWASKQPDILAVALVGSHAPHAMTSRSDVDLIILTPEATKYVNDRSWISLFGKATSCEELRSGRVTSLRVVYGHGLGVEYGFRTGNWTDVPDDSCAAKIVSEGVRTIYDPQGVLDALPRQVARHL